MLYRFFCRTVTYLSFGIFFLEDLSHGDWKCKRLHRFFKRQNLTKSMFLAFEQTNLTINQQKNAFYFVGMK